MAFALAARNSQIVDMNITPLVDVMLVLLIIFMVTMPLRTYGIGIDLAQPDVKSHPQPPPQPITLKIDANGQVMWNGSQLPLGALESAIKVEAGRYADPKDEPVIRIDTDREASYGTLAEVLAAARNAGWVRIGFVDDDAR
ncbi:MAG TPA: biopolymer transporter ExbD [Xanthomonadaceae bacterium]|jgi:biopolymer transport protein ExbD